MRNIDQRGGVKYDGLILKCRTAINNFKVLMSSNTHKNQIQSLSSLSLELNLSQIRDSQIFPTANRKSSFDLVNLLAESAHGQLYRNRIQQSLDILKSSVAIINKPLNSPLQFHLSQLNYNEQDRRKIQRTGANVVQIQQIDSNSEPSDDQEQMSHIEKQSAEVKEEQQKKYNLVEYFPQDLTKLLQEKQIPLQFVRGLLLVREQKEIKSIRKLKVERYLEKRRNKTWNKKICYNCRQKVAEERLRIKGKFIKKRRAMQILGLTTPTSTFQVKRLLQQKLKDKTLKEIQEIIKKQQEIDD